jgi:DNA-binding Lrp family transcriptional regulator
MPSAVVLINCEIGKEQEIVDRVCSLGGVEKAYLVYGVYDIVAILTAATVDGLEATLMQKVRTLPGVKSTMTLMISRDCTSAVKLTQ